MTAIKCLENIELPSFIEIWSSTQTQTHSHTKTTNVRQQSFIFYRNGHPAAKVNKDLTAEMKTVRA